VDFAFHEITSGNNEHPNFQCGKKTKGPTSVEPFKRDEVSY